MMFKFCKLTLLLIISAIVFSPAVYGGSHPKKYDTASSNIHWLVTNSTGIDAWPYFSPDGKQVVYVRADREFPFPKSRLFLVPVTIKKQGKVSQLTSGILHINATRPNWSVKNGKIVFTAIPRHPRGKVLTASIWIIDPKSPKQAHSVIKARRGEILYYPAWYPDGRKIAVMVVTHRFKNRKIIKTATTAVTKRYSLRSKHAHALTSSRRMFAGMPSVSPNGKRIVFAGQVRVKGNSYNQRRNQIWIREPNGKVHQLDPYQGRAPAWSPNGKWITFESSRAGGKNYDIFIERATGGRPIRLTAGHFFAAHPKWSPNGKWIVFNAQNIDGSHSSGIGLIRLSKSILKMTQS